MKSLTLMKGNTPRRSLAETLSPQRFKMTRTIPCERDGISTFDCAPCLSSRSSCSSGWKLLTWAFPAASSASLRENAFLFLFDTGLSACCYNLTSRLVCLVMVHVVATNRKARHEVEVVETIEAGIALTGSEVKSVRAGRCSLQEGYAVLRKGEAILKGVHIAPYRQASMNNPDPIRDRRLLLHRQEIRRLTGQLKERGYTLVPLKIYFQRGYAKVELGLAKGRAAYDKRRKLREQDEKRRTDEALKRYSRGQQV